MVAQIGYRISSEADLRTGVNIYTGEYNLELVSNSKCSSIWTFSFTFFPFGIEEIISRTGRKRPNTQ